MSPSTFAGKWLAGLVVLAAGAVSVSTSSVAGADEPAGCAVTDVDYQVTGRLLIKDTQFGAADGVYPLGAGKVRLRFDAGGEARPAQAKLMSYELDNHLTVKASFSLWSTKVVTDTRTTVPATCEGAAKGVLRSDNLVWATAVDGYHSDGKLECEGNVCGKFGAPPKGESPVHEAPVVTFSPFHFAPDGKTFTMDYAKLSHTDSPRQTTYLSLAGRETSRACVTRPDACQ
jgi:hypothetical protein